MSGLAEAAAYSEASQDVSHKKKILSEFASCSYSTWAILIPDTSGLKPTCHLQLARTTTRKFWQQASNHARSWLSPQISEPRKSRVFTKPIFRRLGYLGSHEIPWKTNDITLLILARLRHHGPAFPIPFRWGAFGVDLRGPQRLDRFAMLRWRTTLLVSTSVPPKNCDHFMSFLGDLPWWLLGFFMVEPVEKNMYFRHGFVRNARVFGRC